MALASSLDAELCLFTRPQEIDMAERIASFPTSRIAPAHLDEWLDGAAWRLSPGEDFEASPQALRTALRNAAKRRGLRVRTRLVGDGGLVVQAERGEEASSQASTPKPSKAPGRH